MLIATTIATITAITAVFVAIAIALFTLRLQYAAAAEAVTGGECYAMLLCQCPATLHNLNHRRHRC
jgi:hypothetical protein